MKKTSSLKVLFVIIFLLMFYPLFIPVISILFQYPFFILIITILIILFLIIRAIYKRKQKIKLFNLLNNNNSSSDEMIQIYSSISDELLIELTIKEELKKINFNNNRYLKSVMKKKAIVTIIFSIINFLFLASIFFHFPFYKYILEIINIIIYIIFMKKFNNVSAIKKEIKARPTENMSYIISSMVTGNTVHYNGHIINIFIIAISCILPIFIFFNPHILYEKVDGGYYVRFYTVGITNYETVTIPETYKNEKVIGIRGNVFKDMRFLKEVNLPDTIEIIRGSAFKNCKSLVQIELPPLIKEIKGNTFEGCSSLERIEIPEGVTRIGGHAFYGCSSLSEVIIPKTLEEIGSSAFRKCNSLYRITIPRKTQVNQRSFKESPTQISYFNDNTGNNTNVNNSSVGEYTLYLNRKLRINSEISFILTNFDDTTHDESIFVGMSGTIKIITKNNTYYFDFQTSTPQIYKYNFEGYTLEIKSGMNDHIKVRFS